MYYYRIDSEKSLLEKISRKGYLAYGKTNYSVSFKGNRKTFKLYFYSNFDNACKEANMQNKELLRFKEDFLQSYKKIIDEELPAEDNAFYIEIENLVIIPPQYIEKYMPYTKTWQSII